MAEHLLFSRRRVLERCAIDWRDEEDVLGEATAAPSGYVGQHLRGALPHLSDLGLVERDRYRVRLTDAGIAQIAAQGPGHTDLVGR